MVPPDRQRGVHGRDDRRQARLRRRPDGEPPEQDGRLSRVAVVRAYDEKTGTRMWEHRFSAGGTHDDLLAIVAVAGRLVAVGTSTPHVVGNDFAFDIRNANGFIRAITPLHPASRTSRLAESPVGPQNVRRRVCRSDDGVHRPPCGASGSPSQAARSPRPSRSGHTRTSSTRNARSARLSLGRFY